MEAKRKLKGFMKGKLMPFYRAAKPSSNVQYSSKVKPSQSSPSSATVGFVVHHQDYLFNPPKPKVSFMVPTGNNRDKVSQLDKLFGVAGDESVDTKAASYISSMQERFKLERINSKHEEMQ